VGFQHKPNENFSRFIVPVEIALLSVDSRLEELTAAGINDKNTNDD
jgi:hypothetical protein